MNRAIIIGHLGADAEVRHTAAGDAVATYNVATTEKWRDKQTNEMKSATEWHRCTHWSPGGVFEYLKKGTQIAVEGSLQTRKWTNKQGQDQYRTEIRVNKVELLGGGKQSQQQTSQPAAQPVSDDFIDEVPF